MVITGKMVLTFVATVSLIASVVLLIMLFFDRSMNSTSVLLVVLLTVLVNGIRHAIHR